MTANFPLVTVNIARQQSLAPAVQHRALIIGQKLAAGTATSGALIENVQDDVLSNNAAFGARSILAEMVREWKKINKVTPVDVIPIDDNAGGTQATASFAFTGTATESGPIFFGVGSDSTYRFRVDVLTGETAATVAGKLQSAVALATTAPFTSALDTADVDFTAANSGPGPNDWSLFVDGSVAGIAVAITGWTGGATGPVLSNTFVPIDSRRYQTIVWPSDFAAATLETELDARFNADNQNLQGVGIQTFVGTATEAIAAATALNSQSMVLIASKTISKTELVGTAHREFPDVVSTRFAAIRALRLTTDASIAQIMTTVAALDQFGGRAIASLPYANSVVLNMPIIRQVDQFTALELVSLRDGGVSAIAANENFSAVVCSEMVTTNTTNESAQPDTSFKFLSTIDTMAAIRDAFFQTFKLRYAQSRLTNGALISSRDMVNKPSFEATTEEIYQSLADDGLVQAGQEAIADFRLNRVVELSLAEGKITFACAPLLVTGLRVILATISVNFGDN